MKKKTLLGILVCLFFSVTHAQIGYQVALLNSATGEPRANETVKAEITITDSQDGTVCSETQTVTSNDFGILSFTVGNADTFKDLYTRKLPLYIAVSVDGVLIGKSQILSVPVAEVAKNLAFDKSLLIGTWRHGLGDYTSYVTFSEDGTGTYNSYGDTVPMKYDVLGNMIILYYYTRDDNGMSPICHTAFYYDKEIWFDEYSRYQKQK